MNLEPRFVDVSLIDPKSKGGRIDQGSRRAVRDLHPLSSSTAVKLPIKPLEYYKGLGFMGKAFLHWYEKWDISEEFYFPSAMHLFLALNGANSYTINLMWSYKPTKEERANPPPVISDADAVELWNERPPLYTSDKVMFFQENDETGDLEPFEIGSGSALIKKIPVRTYDLPDKAAAELQKKYNFNDWVGVIPLEIARQRLFKTHFQSKFKLDKSIQRWEWIYSILFDQKPDLLEGLMSTYDEEDTEDLQRSAATMGMHGARIFVMDLIDANRKKAYGARYPSERKGKWLPETSFWGVVQRANGLKGSNSCGFALERIRNARLPPPSQPRQIEEEEEESEAESIEESEEYSSGSESDEWEVTPRLLTEAEQAVNEAYRRGGMDGKKYLAAVVRWKLETDPEDAKEFVRELEAMGVYIDPYDPTLAMAYDSVFRARYATLTDEQKIELFGNRVANPLDVNECELHWHDIMDSDRLREANQSFWVKFYQYTGGIPDNE